jgi:hypothetical protein
MSAVGILLIAFGPGYLLLVGTASTVPDRTTRFALYVGASLSIASVLGMGINALGFPFTYGTFTSAYMGLIAALFVARSAFAIRRSRIAIEPRAAINPGLAAVPFLAGLILLLTSPVRVPPTTELYLLPHSRQIAGVPDSGGAVDLYVGVTRTAPVSADVVDLHVGSEHLVSWDVPAGAGQVERRVRIDAGGGVEGPVRVEARLRSPGAADRLVWLDVAIRPKP